MSNVLFYFIISGFLIWFIQTQKIFDYFFFNDFLKEIRKCEICLGTWICILMLTIFETGLFSGFELNMFTNILNYVITASLSSFIIYVFKTGWRSLFTITVME